MGSHAQDSSTQKTASAGATQQDQQLAANAAQNQQFANQSRSALFGTYNPTTNSYSGGTESAALNPANLNQTGLSGSYASLYNNASNQAAQTAQNSVGTTLQSMNSHGMGATPAGFDADQQRQAYQQQAATQGNLYANAFGQQHSDAISAYNSANSLLNGNTSQAGSLSESGNSAAAGNYQGLYGQASTQVANPWATAAGSIAQLGTAGAGYMPKPCWIAAELWGGWHEPRTVLVRGWLLDSFSKHAPGRYLVDLYIRRGEAMAAAMRRHGSLRWFWKPIFELALRQARKAVR